MCDAVCADGSEAFHHTQEGSADTHMCMLRCESAGKGWKKGRERLAPSVPRHVVPHSTERAITHSNPQISTLNFALRREKQSHTDAECVGLCVKVAETTGNGVREGEAATDEARTDARGTSARRFRVFQGRYGSRRHAQRLRDHAEVLHSPSTPEKQPPEAAERPESGWGAKSGQKGRGRGGLEGFQRRRRGEQRTSV